MNVDKILFTNVKNYDNMKISNNNIAVDLIYKMQMVGPAFKRSEISNYTFLYDSVTFPAERLSSWAAIADSVEYYSRKSPNLQHLRELVETAGKCITYSNIILRAITQIVLAPFHSLVSAGHFINKSQHFLFTVPTEIPIFHKPLILRLQCFRRYGLFQSCKMLIVCLRTGMTTTRK